MTDEDPNDNKPPQWAIELRELLDSKLSSVDTRLSLVETKLEFFGLHARTGDTLPEGGIGRFTAPGKAGIEARSEWRREKYYKR